MKANLENTETLSLNYTFDTIRKALDTFEKLELELSRQYNDESPLIVDDIRAIIDMVESCSEVVHTDKIKYS